MVALYTYHVQGAIVAVSHDESFVNKLLQPPMVQVGSTDNHHPHNHTTAAAAAEGELWVLSKRRVQRFNGSFSEYKKIITKNIASVG